MADENILPEGPKICKRCQKPAPNSLSCIRCGTVSHKSCLKELQKKYKYIRFYEDDKVICCPKEATAEDSLPPAVPVISEIEALKIAHLEEKLKLKDFTISQMELVIENQKLALDALKEQIVMLKTAKSNLSYANVAESSGSGTTKKVSHKPRVQPSSSKPEIANVKFSNGLDEPNERVVITASQVSAAVRNATVRRACDDAISLGSPANNEAKIGKETMRGPSQSRANSRSILVGNMPSTSNCPIKATVFVPMKHFHVTNLEVTTNSTDLKQYLNQFVPSVVVEKLSARNPDRYSSFKVSVPEAEVQNLLNIDIWPQGIAVNRFFRSRRT